MPFDAPVTTATFPFSFPIFPPALPAELRGNWLYDENAAGRVSGPAPRRGDGRRCRGPRCAGYPKGPHHHARDRGACRVRTAVAGEAIEKLEGGDGEQQGDGLGAIVP